MACRKNVSCVWAILWSRGNLLNYYKRFISRIVTDLFHLLLIVQHSYCTMVSSLKSEFDVYNIVWGYIMTVDYTTIFHLVLRKLSKSKFPVFIERVTNLFGVSEISLTHDCPEHLLPTMTVRVDY